MSDSELVSIIENLRNLVHNERAASYNEGLDEERERCARLVESYPCSTGNLAALAEQIRHPEDVDGDGNFHTWLDIAGRQKERIVGLQEEIERLRSALKPFATYSKHISGINWVPDACPLVASPTATEGEPTVGDLRRAAQALAREQPSGERAAEEPC